MDTEFDTFRPQKMTLAAALLVSVLLIGAFLSVNNVKGSTGQPSVLNASIPLNQPKAATIVARTMPETLGSAFLDLNLLAENNSIDEADNARWSLVRGTPTESQVYGEGNGVDWAALRYVSLSGTYRVAAGGMWSFNQTFQEGHGYKIASGVLAGGHCALATVFRAAAIRAGLPNQAHPHRWPIPGFPLTESVNIWWGRDDLAIENTTAQTLYLAWKLSPEGIEVSVASGQ
jgi:hypothetical protein